MESIDSMIVSSIKKCGRGKVLFASDFVRFGESKSINKALERLVEKETIIRLSRGIYYYPKIDKVLGLGVLYPSLEVIAEAIAKRDRARIIPTGTYAMNRIGLSTQVPMNLVYLTSGTPRNIKIGKGRGLKFIHTAPKNLAYQNELILLIVLALKEIKKDNVTEQHIYHIKNLLTHTPKNTIMADLSLMPAWIRTLIINCYE